MFYFYISLFSKHFVEMMIHEIGSCLSVLPIIDTMLTLGEHSWKYSSIFSAKSVWQSAASQSYEPGLNPSHKQVNSWSTCDLKQTQKEHLPKASFKQKNVIFNLLNVHSNHSDWLTIFDRLIRIGTWNKCSLNMGKSLASFCFIFVLYQFNDKPSINFIEK